MEMLNIIHFSYEDITRHSKHVIEMLLHIWCLTTMRWCPSYGLNNKLNIAKGTTDPGVDCFDQYFGLVGLVQYA